MFHVITQPNCVWCVKVKELLAEKGQQFKVHELPPNQLKLFAEILDFRTVPQVFRDGRRIGGFQETVAFFDEPRCRIADDHTS